MAKRALLIGINKYQIAGADLNGCVNDVKDLKAALVEFHGFRRKDVAVLTDGAATQKAMQAGIKSLVSGAQKGDVLVVHYSGHGSNVPDDNGDESDARDEILCPADLDWDNPFRDDWLRTTFDALPEDVSLTVIMDCCHSGTNTRAMLPPDAPVRPRYLPSPRRLAAVESGRGVAKKSSAKRSRSARSGGKPKDIVNAQLREILITGCRDTQTSADAFINGKYNGALTFALVEAIRKSKGRLTYRQLHDQASTVLK
jgi:metacaspase-1